MMKKLVELKERFESEHGIIAYSVEFVASVAMTFGSSFIAAKLTRKAINKIAQRWKVGKVGSFILSVMIGFIPAFIGSFVSTMTMPSERILKAGIINREREKVRPADMLDDPFTVEREEA